MAAAAPSELFSAKFQQKIQHDLQPANSMSVISIGRFEFEMTKCQTHLEQSMQRCELSFMCIFRIVHLNRCLQFVTGSKISQQCIFNHFPTELRLRVAWIILERVREKTVRIHGNFCIFRFFLLWNYRVFHFRSCIVRHANMMLVPFFVAL